MVTTEKNSKTLYPNLVLAGTRSANGRYYPEDVLRLAVEQGLYHGVPVFLDHDEKIQALVGQVVRAWWDDERKCVRGDVRLFASSPFAEVVRYVFDRWGESFGFSHVVEADVEEEDNKEIVKQIKRVRSVDLVVDPATTKGIQGLQERLQEAKQKHLQECQQQTTPTSLDGILRAIIQSYWNGEVGFGQALSLLSRVLGVEPAQPIEGYDMPKRKYESNHENEKKKMKEQEDTKKQAAPDGEDEKIDLEDEDVAVEQDEESTDSADAEAEDETLEEQDEEGSAEEMEEQSEDEEDSEDEEESEEAEEEDEEVTEEEDEEDEEEEEDEEVLEEDEKQQASGQTQNQEKPKACESKSKKANTLKRKLEESRKLLRQIVTKRYLPTAKEFRIIENSKDPVGVYKILAEAKKKANTGKPKTLTESRKVSQEDEWDRMIAEVRRRKGLIR